MVPVLKTVLCARVLEWQLLSGPAMFHTFLSTSPQTPPRLLGFYRTKGGFWPDFADIKHDYTQEFYRSYSSFISKCLRTG